jgi:hypothetical protein
MFGTKPITKVVQDNMQLLRPRLRVQLCKWFTIFQGCVEFDWADEYFQMDTPSLEYDFIIHDLCAHLINNLK